MDDDTWLSERFEEHRSHLRAVAYRMLGSTAEADDAVQEAWLRVSRGGVDGVDNLGGWLTTVVSRVCLNVLRSRSARREEPLSIHVPDPVVELEDHRNPERETLLADSVGVALLVVLDAMSPAERLAFVLHDLFALPFDEIAQVLGRSPEATRQLASRARRRVQGEAPMPDTDLARQRQVVDAFFAAARDGDFDALLAVRDPDVVARSDGGTVRAALSSVVRGPAAVASRAITYANPEAVLVPATVNGGAGVVVQVAGKAVSVMAFTVSAGRIVEIDSLVDPDRVARLGLDDGDQ